jgi:hypothetical protein
MIADETRATLIAEHYRDACKGILKQLETRNKELLWLFVLYAFTTLNAYYPRLFSELLPKSLEGSLRISVPQSASIPLGFTGFILLFAIALLLADVYNLSVVIERTVAYARQWETVLEELLGKGMVARYKTAKERRPTLIIQATYMFSIGFAVINGALNIVIRWGNSHANFKATGLFFLTLDFLLCAAILYMRVMFVTAFLSVAR